jgi:transcriptional regulator with XRE-family HTH domain
MRPMKNVDYGRLTELGSRIVSAARAIGLQSQAELSREAGVSRAVINQWLYDPHRKPDGLKMLELSRALRCNPYWLAGLDKDMTPVAPVNAEEKKLLKAYKKLRPVQRERLIRDAQERAEEEQERHDGQTTS